MSLQFKDAHAPVLLLLCLGCSVANAIARTPAPPPSPDFTPLAPQAQALHIPDEQVPAAAVPALSYDRNPVENPASPAAAVAPGPAVDALGPCCTLPDGSPVQLEVVGPISSKTAQRGQTFLLRLTQPLRTAEDMLLLAGTEGTGEVIHAERSRGGGKAGELILAVRYLHGPHGQIKLRGMKLGGSGNDKTAAALGASLILPLGGFVRGSEIEIPAGTPASAKLAGAIALPPMPVATPNEATVEAALAPVASEDTSIPATPPTSAPSPPAPTPTPF